MTALLADPVSEVVAAAEQLLTRRTGAPVTLVDPVDLGGSGRTVVLRVRVAENPFSLPRTLVIKQVRDNFQGATKTAIALPSASEGDFDVETAFLREAVSYQFANALAKDARPGAELLASDLDARLLILSDLGDATAISVRLEDSDPDTVTYTLMAMAQAMGRMHAATVGREDDFTALLRRAEVAHCSDEVADQVGRAVAGVPAMLVESLGIDVSSDILEQVQHAQTLFSGGRFRAFSPSDLCPDNIIVNDDGVQFLDYEWGGYRDALLDITYALVSFPGCLCNIDLTEERASAMVDAWRAEVVGMWPALADEAELGRRIVEAQLIWVWLSTYLYLPEDHSRIAAVREHYLSIPRADALVGRWARLARSAQLAGNAAVEAHARDVVAALRTEFS
ncbi:MULTISPECIES: kinase [Rhodococcus]|uniref:kinase n=1 Tax=Rhodococcus TaxID=1827 RepID=UPI001E4984FA|nr:MULTISPECIES: kinase [Rhodococcus]MDF3317341.1 kinase [Rhodococcus sp. C3V]UGQ53838.1 kinase [Rhodococcus qingshengii]